MQDNANTEAKNDSIRLDPVDWQIAFEPYEGNAEDA